MKHICLECATEFSTWKTKTLFCSTQCYAAHRSKKVVCICPQCKISFILKKYRLSVKHGPFCSRKCYYKWRSINLRGDLNPTSNKDQTSLYGWVFQKSRAFVLKRDDYKCVRCGSSKNIHVHHKIHFNPGQSDPHNPNNLEALCASCHRIEHHPARRGIHLPRGKDGRFLPKFSI